jgi:hypothetical protein
MFKTLTGELLTIDQLPSTGVVIIHPETEQRVPLDEVKRDGYYYLLLNQSYLLEWVDPAQLDWYLVCRMPEAIRTIEAHPDWIVWDTLCENPAAMHILERNVDKIKPAAISANPAAIPFLKEHPHLIHRESLCRNPSPDVVDILSDLELTVSEWEILSRYCSNIDFLRANYLKLLWPRVAKNIHSLPLFREFPNLIDSWEASCNPGLVDLILEDRDWANVYILAINKSQRVDEILIEKLTKALADNTLSSDEKMIWTQLSANHPAVMRHFKEHIVWSELCRRPEAIDLIEEQFEKEIAEGQYFPELKQLAENPAALHILEKYADVLDYRELSRNKGIYLS